MPTTLNSIEQVCNWFWTAEKQLNLLRRKHNDIFFWRIMRVPLYRIITEKSGLVDEAHPNTNFSLLQRGKILFELLRDSIFRNPFFCLHKEIVVIPHSRQIDGVDIYSRSLLEQLPAQKTLVLHSNWQGQQTLASRNMAFSLLKNHVLSRWGRYFGNNAVFSEENKILLSKLQDDLHQCFGIKLDLNELAKKNIETFSRFQKDYKKVFQRLKAQKLYIVVGYGVPQLAAVSAAQDCGMEVVELQHGVFTPYHLGYSFPVDGYMVPYTPDIFYTFGSFWGQSTPLPTAMCCQVKGSSYIFEILTSLQSKAKKNNIVFVSQGPISRDLMKFAVEVAQLLPEKNVIYRLHPSEILDNCLSRVLALEPPKNFMISQGTPSTYALLAEAEVLVGVSSTVLFEGMLFGCKIIVVKLPSFEYMLPSLKMGHVKLITSPHELRNAIELTPLCPDPIAYYARPVPISS